MLDPDVSVREFAEVPSDAPSWEALLKEARRAARCWRAEFASR